MNKTFNIMFGIATLVLPAISILTILSNNGWVGMKIIGFWVIIATIYAVKG